MFRGNWRIVVAACGVVLLGAALPPDERNSTESAKPEQRQEAVANPVAPSPPPVTQTNDPPGYTEPCQAGKDDRSSDLCAQWKAADAAEKSAFWTGVGVLVGIFTFAAAGFAAFYARAAAVYTNRAAVAAKEALAQADKISKLELRAYLAIAPMGINQLIASEKGMGHVALRNVGILPARNVSLFVKMEFFDDRKTDFPIPKDTDIIDRVIQSGDQMIQGSDETDTITVTDIINKAGRYVFVWGVAYYDDGYKCRRFTRFCHRYATASYNRKIKWASKALQTRAIIDADKARYHTHGNDAD